MPVLIKVSRRVTRVIVMLSGFLLLGGVVAVSVLIRVTRDMVGVVVVFAGLFAGHVILLSGKGAGSPVHL